MIGSVGVLCSSKVIKTVGLYVCSTIISVIEDISQS